MGHLHLEHLTAKPMLMLVLAIVLGVLVFRATKHLVMAAVSLAVAAAVVIYVFDIVTLQQVEHAAVSLKDRAQRTLDGAKGGE